MKKRIWLIVAALLLAVTVGLFIAASLIRKRFEPFIRQQAIAWLQDRFESDVELASLHVHIGPASPIRLLLTRGRGTLARVDGSNLVLRQRGRGELPPTLAIRTFSFVIDLGEVFDTQKTVSLITVDGLEINIPPKGERSGMPATGTGSSGQVDIEEVVATNARLVLLPKAKGKKPLKFDIARLQLRSVGKGVPMKYDASLTNPKPPGQIQSTGTFGPWSAPEPGDTPLSGDYTFDKADLGVFSGIAGTLHSTGHFEGTLSAINARGQASVPDFRLKRSGNKVPLTTSFEVLVDGSNGNTILQPVRATLGNTQFTTSGAVIRQEGEVRRTIALNVSMPSGDLEDILRLAMPGAPFMQGRLSLKSRLDIPPLDQKVRQKLDVDGSFAILRGRFLRSNVQDKIDALSRRGQGQPKNEEISDVFSNMKGRFRLDDEVITFRSLSFSTTGASVNLAGNYNLVSDALDFHGSLGLRARLSQTMTGWKRWALKPVDPFFAKQGSGTFLRIKIDGTAKSPNFGLDHGQKDHDAKDRAAK